VIERLPALSASGPPVGAGQTPYSGEIIMATDKSSTSVKPLSRPAKLDRRLGATENIYYLLDKLYCLNFVVFAEITGKLELDRINQALSVVQLQQPLLRTHISLVDGRHWFKPAEIDRFPLQAEVGSLKNWRTTLCAQYGRPFADKAPLARFLWLGGRGNKSVAAMVFHHSIADGKSGTNILLEVLRRAGGEAIPVRYQAAHPAAQELDLIQQKGALQGSLQRLKYWLAQGKSVLKFAQQLPGYDASVTNQQKIKFISFDLPAPAAKRLLANCRTNGTTMHGAIGAAQILAVNKEFETAEARTLALNSLADLRSVLQGNLTEVDLGLYIATLTTVHAVGASPDFWGLATDIRGQLKEILNSGDGDLVHSIYRKNTLFPPNKRGAKMVQTLVALAPPATMLTNIGRVDAITLANGAIVDAVAFGVSPPAQNPLCVTATTYADRLYLNLLYDEYKVSPGQARRIGKNLLAYLAAAAAS
jgi:NRPS condensation-like uncharacterized protein